MPKIKMKRNSTNVDMTAMCDVAFLLLTFFMLATKFKPDEPVVVVTPSSISQIPLPDTSIMMITVDNKDRVFFTVDKKNVAIMGGKDSREGLIRDMDEFKGLGLNEDEIQRFSMGSSIGVPLNQLKSYLGSEDPKALDRTVTGIPVDTSAEAPNNELAAWIRVARNNNPYLRIVIKADADARYPTIQKVISTLGGMKIFSFNLLTNLEGVPPGTAAYDNAQKREG